MKSVLCIKFSVNVINMNRDPSPIEFLARYALLSAALSSDYATSYQ